MKFSELHIHPDIIRACTDAGFETLTEIQEKCLIPATQGRDIAGISQTGTGKTVAFLLPLLDRIVKDNLPGPAALIITPTRELCLQIAEEALKLTKHGPVSVSAVYGGEGYRKQEEELAKNPQIIVATPGRLIDYIKQGKIDLNKLHFLVLDEADRMFDMGFIRDIGFIMKKVPREAQTMLFSATLSYYVMRLAADFMNDPVEVRIEAETVAVDKIDQQLFHLGKDEKMPYLINQVLAVPGIRAIVFTNLRVYVSTIVNNLRRYGVHATGLSSMLDQKKRVRLLKDFKLGKYSVLVATDVASRGLDVDDITHVFNYDLPQDAESYVHRIGRTARAGRSGISISYCSEMDYEALPRVES
ncbi:MAG TPA: DEAD/DEAH box helicase, partial [Leptospiraceae bacterium]|nr:DEAD/DEAH box helicase [Leptospiraceae bacterium]